MIRNQGQSSSRINNHVNGAVPQIMDEVTVDVVGNGNTQDEMLLLDYLQTQHISFDYYVQLFDLAKIRMNKDNKKHVVVLLTAAYDQQEIQNEL